MTHNNDDDKNQDRQQIAGNSRPSSIRWSVLAMSCLTMAGVYYSFDIPAALHQQIHDSMATTNTASQDNNNDAADYAFHFNLLYTVYSVPNVILPFFGGKIVDHLGPPKSTLLFASFAFFGQIIFSLGIMYQSWNIMYIGRFVYGLGGECISVATSTLNSVWFQGKELAFSFGVSLAVGRLGSVCNNWISPILANKLSIYYAFWYGVLMNFVSVFASMCIWYLSWSTEAYSSRYHQFDSGDSMHMPLLGGGQNELDAESSILTNSLSQKDYTDQNPDSPLELQETKVSVSTSSSASSSSSSISEKYSLLSQMKNFGIMFWILSLSCVIVYGCILPFNNIASGILMERNYFIKPPLDCKLLYPDQCTSGNILPSNFSNPSFDSMGQHCPLENYIQPILPSSIHIESNSSSYYTDSNITTNWKRSSYVYTNITDHDIDCNDPFWSQSCTQNYCALQSYATEKSGRVMSIPYFLSALFSPIFGYVIDNIGHRALIASMSSILLSIVHYTLSSASKFASSPKSPILPLVGQGLAYSCYAAVIWPSVPLTVPEDIVGLAFGTITSIQNIGLAAFPLVIAWIYNSSGEQYIPNVEYFFVVCGVVGTCFAIILNIFDKKHGGHLNRVQ